METPPVSGGWEGRFYRENDGGVPSMGTGVFHPEYEKNGPVVGAFGVNPDEQTCSTRVAALCMTLSDRHSFHPRPVMDRGVLFYFDCNTAGLGRDSGVAPRFASGPKAKTC